MRTEQRFAGHYRFVEHGQPVQFKKTAYDAIGVIQQALALNGSAVRTGKPSWDMAIYQGKKGPTSSTDPNFADEFRVFTDDTATAIKGGKLNMDTLLTQPPDGDIEVTQLLNPALASRLFSNKTYQINTVA